MIVTYMEIIPIEIFSYSTNSVMNIIFKSYIILNFNLICND